MKYLTKEVIIAIAIIVGSIIISERIPQPSSGTSYNENSYRILDLKQTSFDTYEQNRESEYNHWIKSTNGQTLVVWQGENKLEFSGIEVKGEFYSVGQLLIVTYMDSDSIKKYHYFNRPDRWELQ